MDATESSPHAVWLFVAVSLPILILANGPVVAHCPPQGDTHHPLTRCRFGQLARKLRYTEITVACEVGVRAQQAVALRRAHAFELARRGPRIVVNDVGGSVNGEDCSVDAAEAVVSKIAALGRTALANHDSVATAWGGESIVAAATSTSSSTMRNIARQGISQMESDMIDAVIDVHPRGALFVSQPTFRNMRAAGYGRIVSKSSTSGLIGNFGQAHYARQRWGSPD